MHLALAQLFVIFFVFISEINRKKKMTVVCPSTIRPVLNDFDWVENAGILSSFIPVEKCPSVMTLDCVQKHVAKFKVCNGFQGVTFQYRLLPQIDDLTVVLGRIGGKDSDAHSMRLHAWMHR